MRRRQSSFLQVLHSATPAFASVVAAAAYGVGAIVFSFASEADPANLPEFSVTYEPPSLYSALSNEEMVRESPPELAPAEAVAESRVVPPQVEPASRAAAATGAPAPSSRPRIALVIDDVGLDMGAAERTANLGVSISMAVLPYAERSRSVAELVRGAGHDLLVHMPMEPLGLADPGPHALRVGLSEEELRLRVRWAFARVPGAIGLNNHMGSRFTQDSNVLRPVLEAVSEESGLFLDSMTTPHSRGAVIARGVGLTALERDIFLDHTIDRAAITARLDELEALASLRGWAIAIGHPHAETLDALEVWIGEVEARGFEFITLSELARSLEAPSQAVIQASIR